jgi:peptide/nickel transport system substrate-binding protein
VVHPNRSRAKAAALAVAVALALSACGSSAKKNSGTPDKSKDINASSGNDINRQPRDKIADGGTLRWPEVEIPANYNVNEVDGTDSASFDVISGVLEQPFYADVKGVAHVNAALLTSGSITSTSPKQVVTYKINPKAVWSDGKPVGEADFEAQWKALNGSNPAFQTAGTIGYDKIESVVKGADDREVVVTYSQPYSDWQALFAPLYPASTDSTPDAFQHDWEGKVPVSDGPFKLDGIDQTSKTVTLVRNDKWWGDPPKLEKMIYRTIDLDAQTDALANGEIDLQYGIGSHVSYYARAKSLPGVTVHRAAGPVWANLTLNAASGPLADLGVRNALTVGVNRKQVNQAIIGPLGVSTEPLNNHVFFTNQNGYQDNSGDLGKFDPARAKQLLDTAGWKSTDGGKTRSKDGQQLKLRYVISSTNDTTKQIAEIVQSQLADIGVTADIVPVPGKDYYNKYVNTGAFDIALVTLGGNAYPISNAVSVFVKPKTGTDGKLDIQQNYSRVGTDEIDQLFGQATTQLDAARAIAVANQADAKIWQLDAIIPLYQRPQVVATKATLANYGAPGVEDTVYENLGFVSGG